MGGRLSVSIFSLEKNTKKPGKDILSQTACFILCMLLFCPLMHSDLWGLPWQTNQSHHLFSLQCCTHPGRVCKNEENAVLQQPLETSLVLRSKRHDDDYQTPFPTLIPALAQLGPVIWELMLRSWKLASILSLTAKNLFSPTLAISGLFFVGRIRTVLFHSPQQKVFLTDPTHVPGADRKWFSKDLS